MNLIEELKIITPENNCLIIRDEFIKGYNEREIHEIEKRYNLSIHGELKEWLTLMGKNSGGLLLGYNINIYNKYSKPTNDYFGTNMQKAWQDEFDCTDFLELINYSNLEKEKFFLIGNDEQVFFYFMLTNNQDDVVYVYYDGEGDKKPYLKIFGSLFHFLKCSRRYTYCNITGEDIGDFLELTTGKLL